MTDTVQNNVTIENCEAPEWFTKDYLEDRLCKYYKDPTLYIVSLEFKPVTGKGENFCAELFRIGVHYKQHGSNAVRHASYILKTSFDGDEFAKKLMEPYDVFNTEMSIYENVLPKLSTLMLEIGDNDQIFANTIAVNYERSALILEDLNLRGFTMPDRKKGIDMKLIRMVLKKLAKLHATSAVLNERLQGILQSYDRGLFNRHTSGYSPCFVGLLDACGHLVSQWPEYRQYGKKLLELRTVFMEYGQRVFDPIDGHLNVLVHGDLWINNLMVKYDKITNEPLDVLFIDFQYSTWGSPAIDLHYFLNTSLPEETSMQQQEGLLQFYYYILVDALKALNFKGRLPTLHKFFIQMEEKGFHAFSSSCVFKAVQINEETEDADFNALMKDDERAKNFKKTVYKNERMQRYLRRLLPIYDQKGLLDLEQ